MSNAGFMRLLRRGDFGSLTAERYTGPTVAVAPFTITSATYTLTKDEHAGRLIVLDKADGIAVTLPKATGSGAVYKFLFKATASGGTYVIKVANSTDVYTGSIYVFNDTPGAQIWTVAAVAGADTATFNGTTQGGYLGDFITVTDAIDGIYLIEGTIKQTGTEATPFSAGV